MPGADAGLVRIQEQLAKGRSRTGDLYLDGRAVKSRTPSLHRAGDFASSCDLNDFLALKAVRSERGFKRLARERARAHRFRRGRQLAGRALQAGRA